MTNVDITTEYIKLEQFLKLASIIGSGGESRSFIADNEILVNGELEKRRGRKLRNNDVVEINGDLFKIIQIGESK